MDNKKTSKGRISRKKRKNTRTKKIRRIMFVILILSSLVIFKDPILEGIYVIKVEASEAFSSQGILLVNKDYALGEDYKPEDLQEVNVAFVPEASSEEKLLTKKAANALEKLFKDSEKEGIIFLGSSGYRSYESQKAIYIREAAVKGKDYAKAYVALPGSSEHQTGLSIDVTNKDRWFVESTKEARWLAENCHKYGFIIRYPKDKEDITGISYEPWHLRYVGVKAAEEIYNKGLALEEYLKK